ncbi:MAG: hypothetical protein L6Q35_13675, partial [Phycisphaerales bacterium]|nr:hypothetical protein [Phycisphaerales bacterium]
MRTLRRLGRRCGGGRLLRPRPLSLLVAARATPVARSLVRATSAAAAIIPASAAVALAASASALHASIRASPLPLISGLIARRAARARRALRRRIGCADRLTIGHRTLTAPTGFTAARTASAAAASTP